MAARTTPPMMSVSRERRVGPRTRRTQPRGRAPVPCSSHFITKSPEHTSPRGHRTPAKKMRKVKELAMRKRRGWKRKIMRMKKRQTGTVQMIWSWSRGLKTPRFSPGETCHWPLRGDLSLEPSNQTRMQTEHPLSLSACGGFRSDTCLHAWFSLPPPAFIIRPETTAQSEARPGRLRRDDFWAGPICEGGGRPGVGLCGLCRLPGEGERHK
ncbi:hypothetical protein P4O66_003281 [Electrophorus voltai]|uniref:Uncharacterized protein n=1 Tax=Electrophorus voltai TaxID=2609070 RepID=A0AAD8YQ59_9TELE|nr:hypothetical protein P4O66_003281 [Electrophorus voltai]